MAAEKRGRGRPKGSTTRKRERATPASQDSAAHQLPALDISALEAPSSTDAALAALEPPAESPTDSSAPDVAGELPPLDRSQWADTWPTELPPLEGDPATRTDAQHESDDPPRRKRGRPKGAKTGSGLGGTYRELRTRSALVDALRDRERRIQSLERDRATLTAARSVEDAGLIESGIDAALELVFNVLVAPARGVHWEMVDKKRAAVAQPLSAWLAPRMEEHAADMPLYVALAALAGHAGQAYQTDRAIARGERERVLPAEDTT